MVVLIAGGRDFSDYDLLKQKCDNIINGRDNITILAAAEKGFGSLAIKYAKDKHYLLDLTKVDWQGWGKDATRIAYEEMACKAEAAIIFWNGQSYNEKLLIGKLNGKPCRVISYQSIKQMVEAAEEKLPKEKKSKKPLIIPDWCKERYKLLHQAWQERTTPEAVKDHGYVQTKLPKINSASPLQTWLENIFNWSGHHMQRAYSGGTYRNGKWTTSGTTVGATDNNGHYVSKNHIFPVPVYIETKFGKDKLSKDQVQFQGKIRKTGALHFIQSHPEDAFYILDYLETI